MDFLISVITASIRMAIPIGYAAIAGAISEKAGVVALGLEGYMVIGAFFAAVGSWFTGSAYGGILMAGACGGLAAVALAVLCIRFKSNQVVAGVGLNTLAPGLAAVLMMAVWGNKGKSEMVAGLQPIHIPVLKDIPVLGALFSGYTILAYLLAALMLCAWVVLYKTPIGIRLRATGSRAEVVDSLGLGAGRIQYAAVILSGVIAGIGGSYLSLDQLSFYSKDMVAGRGFIAVAIFVFARWNPIACVLVALFFGFTMAIQFRLQTLAIPPQFLQMLPYLCALLVISGIGRGKRKKRKAE